MPPKTTVSSADELIDDFRDPDGRSRLGTHWRLVTDTVMGGVSSARMSFTAANGRRALCVEGEVKLEHNGGFLQANLDLTNQGRPLDASDFTGLRLIVCGNGERYNLHLKSRDCALPWQAYRATFVAGPDWQEIRIPFEHFTPNRLSAPLAADQLTQLGLVAIGRAFHAQVCVAEVGWYRGLDAESAPSPCG
ncbi:NADH:ubiquinone oxidoreductase complex I intermediate-associated protein 30 [Thiorhodococcus drewsii AZ1]|uniref:NADH:ubiquinone oxidoreductase complex I intermediate-associated protein 30 n=1 Tax=Thiorhodococcus drewsii AZ1 TaxID=765913 RepID=G2E6T1_9GAMM|nr:CIA30 family protein [Thiorhodococcus drewsii]EGV28159.1 NADH:ubiquinone oxidoreductase complex I intermediate-associated protein 30 [Thiorhodococcus drewsii AZ1]